MTGQIHTRTSAITVLPLSWRKCTNSSWWRHQMETFSALLAICAGKNPVNSPHKGQWRGVLMFSLICIWINGWVNNGEAGDLRRYHAIMTSPLWTHKSHHNERYWLICREVNNPLVLLPYLAGSSLYKNNTTLSDRFDIHRRLDRTTTETNTEFERITRIWTLYNSIYTLQYLCVGRIIRYCFCSDARILIWYHCS